MAKETVPGTKETSMASAKETSVSDIEAISVANAKETIVSVTKGTSMGLVELLAVETLQCVWH